MKAILKKITLLCFVLICTNVIKAQTTCTTSVTYSYPVSGTVTSYTASDYWFKVTTPGAGSYQLKIDNGSGTGKIWGAYVYTGTCPSLTLTAQDSIIDSTYTSFYIGLQDTASTTFYIDLINRPTAAITFSLSTVRQVNIGGQLSYLSGQNDTLFAMPLGGSGTPSYTWNPGGLNTAQIISTATTSTTYTLTYKDALGTLTSTATANPFTSSNCQLVPNSGFENMLNNCNQLANVTYSSGCSPNGPPMPNWGSPAYWTAPTCGTPDHYLSIYNTTSVGSPVNWLVASPGLSSHGGTGTSGYIGLAIYYYGSNYREYIQTPLFCPLVTGQKYDIGFWTALDPGTGSWSSLSNPSNNVGAYLSTTAISAGGTSYLSYTPQANALLPLNNPGTWTQVTGTITGAGEKYITLGNFYSGANTSLYPSTTKGAYYFLDDITVSPATPTLTASSCQSGSVTITAVGVPNSTITTWAGPASYTASGSSITVTSPTVAATYTLTVNLNSGCGSCTNLTQTITVNPAPACSGTAPTYTPASNSSYTFTTSPGYAANDIYVGSGVNYVISSTDFRIAAGKSIVVSNTGTLTIAGSWLHACNTCTNTAMWQGIKVNNGGTLIIDINSVLSHGVYTDYANIIEDAVQGVYTASSASTTPIPSWAISNVIFNNCSTGVYIDSHQGNLSGNSLWENCIFTCRKLSNHSLVYSNFTAIKNDIAAATPVATSIVNPADLIITGIRTLYGIYINAVNVTNPINIGGNNSSHPGCNFFDNLNYGIYSYQSSLTAINNTFQNITGNSFTTPPTGVGIYSDAYLTSTTGVNASLTVGNTGTTIVTGETNNFTDCLDGVYTKNMKHIYINNNVFDNETTATTFTTSLITGQYGIYNAGYAASAITTPPENLIFANNSVKNYATGVYLDFQKLYNTTNATSYLYNNIISGAGTALQYCKTGLYLQQSNSFGAKAGYPWDGMSVSTNSITNIGTNCISASSITTNSLVTVKNNTLTIKYTTAGTSTLTPPYAAVYVTGCNYFKLWNNAISCEGLSGSYPTSYAQYIAGVYIDASTNSRITCNAVTNIGEDFVWKGNSASSAWWENTMHNSRYGLVLRSTGIMGDQISDGNPHFDVWGIKTTDISSYQTLCDNSDPSSTPTSKLWYSFTSTSCTTTTTQLPCTNTVSAAGGVAYANGSTMLVSSTGGSPGVCVGETPGTGRMANNNSAQDAVSDSVLLSLLNFTDSLPAYTHETYWGTQYYVSSANANLATVQGYENAKTFALADAAIAADSVNDLTAAETLINGINPTNIIENNWKVVDNIVIKMRRDSLDQSDIGTLQAVASQCPQKGGNIVWRARTILNNYYGSASDYPGDCPDLSGDTTGNVTRKVSVNSSEKKQNVQLYPNPNNGTMTLEYSIKDESRLEISDVSGNLVITYNLPATGSVLQLKNENLQNGVYVYRVIGGNGIIKTGKIVVLK